MAAEIINSAERKFIGINENGRRVNIFYKDGNVIITEGDNVTRIITGYGPGAGKPSAPANINTWINNPNFFEIH